MAAGVLDYEVTLDGARFAGPLNRLEAGLGGFQGKLGALGGAIAGLTASLAGLLSSALLVRRALGETRELEDLTIAFKTLLGSATAAKERLAELARFAESTPFELGEIARASRILETLTKGALASGEGLRLVGDVAAATGQPFAEVAVHVGRLYDGLNNNRPVGEAMMRLQELGIISSEVRGKIEELQKAQARGADVWAVGQAALQRFGGSMQDLSQSGTGLMSTLRDGIAALMRKFGEPINAALKPVIQSLIDGSGKLTNVAAGLGQAIALLVTEFGSLIAIARPVLDLLSRHNALVGVLTSALVTLAVAYGALKLVQVATGIASVVRAVVTKTAALQAETAALGANTAAQAVNAAARAGLGAAAARPILAFRGAPVVQSTQMAQMSARDIQLGTAMGAAPPIARVGAQAFGAAQAGTASRALASASVGAAEKMAAMSAAGGTGVGVLARFGAAATGAAGGIGLMAGALVAAGIQAYIARLEAATAALEEFGTSTTQSIQEISKEAKEIDSIAEKKALLERINRQIAASEKALADPASSDQLRAEAALALKRADQVKAAIERTRDADLEAKEKQAAAADKWAKAEEEAGAKVKEMWEQVAKARAEYAETRFEFDVGQAAPAEQEKMLRGKQQEIAAGAAAGSVLGEGFETAPDGSVRRREATPLASGLALVNQFNAAAETERLLASNPGQTQQQRQARLEKADELDAAAKRILAIEERRLAVVEKVKDQTDQTAERQLAQAKERQELEREAAIKRARAGGDEQEARRLEREGRVEERTARYVAAGVDEKTALTKAEEEVASEDTIAARQRAKQRTGTPAPTPTIQFDQLQRVGGSLDTFAARPRQRALYSEPQIKSPGGGIGLGGEADKARETVDVLKRIEQRLNQGIMVEDRNREVSP